MFDSPPSKQGLQERQFEVPLLTFAEQTERPDHARQVSNTRTLFGEPLTPVTSFNASLRSTDPVQSTHSRPKGFGGIFMIILVWILIFLAACGIAVGAGAVSMLIGNALLGAYYHSGRFTDNLSAATIGAVGGSIAFVVVTILFYACMNLFMLPFAVIIHGAASGGIGSSILNSLHMSIGGISSGSSAFAGTVGGCILVVPVFVISTVLITFVYVRTVESNLPLKLPTFGKRK